MKHLNALEIIQLLSSPTKIDSIRIQEYFDRTGKLPPDHGYIVKSQIRKEASIRELIAALHQTTNSHVREVLCDLLGELQAKTAFPVLITCLEDSAAGVRSSAADALAKIGNPLAGEALMKRFAGIETEIEVQRMIAVALGAVGYRPAIPLLIKALVSIDPDLRGSAAWSLGVLKSLEAANSLEQALSHEKELYPRERMKIALDTIQQVN
jgi:HEAT repeat protein